ncbi:Arfaptin-2 [Chamberlinius hualienensis]
MMSSSVINGVDDISLEEDNNFDEHLREILNDSPSRDKMSANTMHSSQVSPGITSPVGSKPSPSHPTSFNSSNISANAAAPASITVPLNSPGSPSQNGDPKIIKSSQSKIDTIKNWSISTYKCTKQILSERLGKTSRTVDPELESQIEALRETQRKYATVLRLARALTSHFYHVVQTQHALGDVFADLAQKSPELQEEFLYNADTQRNLTKNGETLIGALNFFVSTVHTLCNKTMEDTLLTVKLYENARVEYDAYRTDLELLTQASMSESNIAKLDEANRNFAVHKERFDRLRQDVAIKMKFLDENKVKVMHKQLLLFHNAVSAYFSGNQQALEATLKQFNIKLKTPNSVEPSWIEQQ